jgi:hypothetical protein
MSGQFAMTTTGTHQNAMSAIRTARRMWRMRDGLRFDMPILSESFGNLIERVGGSRNCHYYSSQRERYQPQHKNYQQGIDAMGIIYLTTRMAMALLSLVHKWRSAPIFAVLVVVVPAKNAIYVNRVCVTTHELLLR